MLEGGGGTHEHRTAFGWRSEMSNAIALIPSKLRGTAPRTARSSSSVCELSLSRGFPSLEGELASNMRLRFTCGCIGATERSLGS